MTKRLGLTQARAAWWQRQGLDGGGSGSLASVISRSGWLRTLGGADVYIAARARRPGSGRGELDAAVAAGELRVVPAARGCIYLVPAAVVPDLMAHNTASWLRATEKDLGKLGKKLAVVEALIPGVLAALAGGPLNTDSVRRAVNPPSFGEAGKKIGLSSPLPLALRLLELRGEIERTLDGGQLDSERYLWRKVKARPAAASKDPLGRVLETFLAYAGPATIPHLAAWSGLAQRDVKAALDKLDVAPVAIDGLGDAWVRRGDLAATEDAPPPRGMALLAFEDNYLINHGTLGAVADPKHHGIETDIWGSGKPDVLGQAAHVLSRMIVVDGLIAGFWEVDPRTAGAVWWTFEPAPRPLAAAIDERTAGTAKFLLDELGHAKSFTLDTMEDVQDRADRIAKLRDRKPARRPIAAKRVAKPVKKPARRRR